MKNRAIQKTSAATPAKSSTSTEVRSPTSTSTDVRSPTSTSTEAETVGNFTVTVTGGAGAGATTVNITAPKPTEYSPPAKVHDVEKKKNACSCADLSGRAAGASVAPIVSLPLQFGESEAVEPAPGMRRITSMAAEPLLAVYEDDAEDPTVFGCGTSACDPLTTGQPVALRIEKFKAGALIQGDEFELPKDLQNNYGEANRVGTPNCLPWVRISRDPERFSSCLAAARKLGRMDSAKKVHTLFKRHAAKEDQEVFYVLLLDVHLYVRGVGEISRGARDRVQTPIPDILRLPIIEGATTFIVVHNHPSGNVKPSEADKQITQAIAQAAAKVEVPLFDHVIVGADKYYSFYEHKLL